jgi:hypothetical protein
VCLYCIILHYNDIGAEPQRASDVSSLTVLLLPGVFCIMNFIYALKYHHHPFYYTFHSCVMLLVFLVLLGCLFRLESRHHEIDTEVIELCYIKYLFFRTLK